MMNVKDKKVFILGFGRCGVSLIKVLSQQGAKISVYDYKTRGELGKSISDVSNIPDVNIVLGRLATEMFQGMDLIILSNSVNWNLPELEIARSQGIPVCYELDYAFQCTTNRPKTMVVTGTHGKSSVAYMISEMLKQSGKTAFLQGELGYPLSESLLTPTPCAAWVIDASAKLINHCPSLKTEALIITNTYNQIPIDELRKMILKMENNAVLILNKGDETCDLLSRDYTGRMLQFLHQDITKLASIDYGKYEGSFMQKKRMMALRFKGENHSVVIDKYKQEGEFCRENLMAACCGVACFGVPLNIIKDFVVDFRGAPHRLEFVRRKDAVNFYNDSESQDVANVIRSTNSFDQQVVLIMGGKDEDKPYDQLVNMVKKKVKCLILVGESKERINRIIGDYTETYLVGTFEEAVFLSYQKTRNGDIVLLSPGCSATDMFKKTEERGEYYRKLVHQI